MTGARAGLTARRASMQTGCGVAHRHDNKIKQWEETMGKSNNRGVGLTWLAGVGSLAIALTAQSALAQDAASPAAADDAAAPAEDDGRLQEIIVTGQKRAGTVDAQRVSVSVTAVDAAAIDRNAITTIEEVGRLAPNVQLQGAGTFSNYANFFIRGIGVSLSIRTVDQAVGLFSDGVYIGYAPESLPDTFDMSSVEIFRGPQGTLFGKNVTGGAVVLEHQRPTDRYEGYLQGTIGSYGRLDVGGVVNLPLGDTLALRVAALKQGREGYWKDASSGKDLNGVDTFSIRPSLRWRPNSDIDVVLRGEYVRDTGGASAIEGRDSRIEPRRVGTGYVPTPALTQLIFGYVPPSDKYSVDHNLRGYVDAKVYGANLNADIDLGHGVVTTVLGYRKVRYGSSTDFDGSPYLIFQFPDNRESQSQKSGELRYASKFSDVVEFTAGLYYFTQQYSVGERREYYAGGGAAAPIYVHVANVAREKDRSYAAFLQGSVKVLDGVKLVLGGRYNDEKKQIEICPFNATLFTNLSMDACPVARLDGELRAKGFTPKLGVDWQVTDDVLAYVSATKGLKSGAFNARATNLPSLGPALDESVWSYEAGIKSELFDRRLRANLAVYYTDYKNVQRPSSSTVIVNGVPTVANFVQNAASARIWGTEFELNAAPVRGLTLDASLGYTNARFRSFTGIDADRNGVYNAAIDDPLAEHLRFERVPTWQYALGAGYEFDVGAGSIAARASYNWRSSQFADTINTPVLKIPSYGLLDANLTFTSASEKLRVMLFGRNLTKEVYWEYGYDGGSHRFTAGGAPRTWGVEVRVRY